jgi:hypothetical protein
MNFGTPAFNFNFGGSTPSPGFTSSTFGQPAARKMHEPTEKLRWKIANVKIYEWSEQNTTATVLCEHVDVEGLVCSDRNTFRLLASCGGNVYMNHLIIKEGSAPEIPEQPKPYYGVDKPELSRAKSAWDFAATGEAQEKTFILEFITKADFEHFKTHHDNARKFCALKDILKAKTAKKLDEKQAEGHASLLVGEARDDYINRTVKETFQKPEVNGNEHKFYEKYLLQQKSRSMSTSK